MELFMAEVSGWKLLTVDVEGFVLDVMWFLDLPLSICSGVFYILTTPF